MDEIAELRKVKCKFCQYIWFTKSRRLQTTCPNCARANKIEEMLLDSDNQNQEDKSNG